MILGRAAPGRVTAPEGFIELGELCRVHRGTVTGANATWIVRHHSDLPPSVLYPSVTKARELFAAGTVLASHEHLRFVVDIPAELDMLDPAERERVIRFIRAAKKVGVDKGYIAAHRRAWWSVGLKSPAPILATYMARRPPAFVMNAAQARHINIAHGLYPRQPLDDDTLSKLAGALRAGRSSSQRSPVALDTLLTGRPAVPGSAVCAAASVPATGLSLRSLRAATDLSLVAGAGDRSEPDVVSR